MKIKMRFTQSKPTGIRMAGKEYDVPKEEAEQLICQKAAYIPEDPKKNKKAREAAQKKNVETRPENIETRSPEDVIKEHEHSSTPSEPRSPERPERASEKGDKAGDGKSTVSNNSTGSKKSK